jgi:hypothetical protein
MSADTEGFVVKFIFVFDHDISRIPEERILQYLKINIIFIKGSAEFVSEQNSR